MLRYRYLQGLAPPLAKQLVDATKGVPQLTNNLGFPKTSSFVTLGYDAGPHVDEDASCSLGYVVKRPDVSYILDYRKNVGVLSINYRTFGIASRTLCGPTLVLLQSFAAIQVGYGKQRTTFMGQQ